MFFSLETITRLKVLDIKWTRAIKFWFERVKEGYLVEYAIECSESFSSTKRKFEVGPIGRLLVEIFLWIKMFVENRLMRMKLDRMTV